MLNAEQLTILKADIAADPAFASVPMNDDGHQVIADAYNLLASPDYWAYRTSVTKAEYTQTTSQDGTTFDWTGTGFITRNQGERDAWRELFNVQDACNPSLASVRQAFIDIFSGGTAPAPANRIHLATVSRRKTTRGEKLFATGTGTTGTPGVMTFEGQIMRQDVSAARNQA